MRLHKSKPYFSGFAKQLRKEGKISLKSGQIEIDKKIQYQDSVGGSVLKTSVVRVHKVRT